MSDYMAQKADEQIDGALHEQGYQKGIDDAIAVIKDRKSWFGIKGNESLEGLCDWLVREIKS